MDMRNVFIILLVTIIPSGLTEKNYLSKSSSSGDRHKDAEKLIKVTTVCNREQLKLNINLNKPFKGVVFAKDFSEECYTRGKLFNAYLFYIVFSVLKKYKIEYKIKSSICLRGAIG